MRQLAEREERHAVRADLITLEAACALAFHRIYGADPEYSLSMKSRDLRAGAFLEGGRRLCFPMVSGPPITRLAVRASAMRQAIEQLAGLRDVLEAFARNINASAVK